MNPPLTTWPTYDKGDVFLSPEDIAAAMEALRAQLFFRYDFRPYEETFTGRFERRLCEVFGAR